MRTWTGDDLKLDAQGRSIVEALGGQWNARGAMCRCPAHTDQIPSLSVRPGQRRLLFHCFAGCDANAIMRALRAMRLFSPGAAPIISSNSPATSTASLSLLAARIWSGARAIAGSPAARYLEARGIALLPGELRYHPRTPHGRAPLTSFRPALIAAVRDDVGLVGVHRTFLDLSNDGLADLPIPKSALGRLGGGAVRLAPPANGILGLAEGVETALSVMQLFDVPCWAALGTERFRHVAIPSSVQRLILFLDNDAGGRRAERLARDTHAGASFSIEARYPQQPKEDWNDVLKRKLGIASRIAKDREESEAAVRRTG